ncbi:MAG: hypothetical protein ACQGVC_12915 [Myxococcota bacterium]
MLLGQGRYWRSSFARGTGVVALELRRAALPEELYELRDLRIEVPLTQWNRVVKHAHSDRKLLGGLLLDFAKHKDRVSAAVGSDRLLAELRRVILDATAVTIEEGVLCLTAPGSDAS